MDRVDVLLRGQVRDGRTELVEVWWDYYLNGERVERLQLRRELDDPRWSVWETTLFETTSRAQLSLF